MHLAYKFEIQCSKYQLAQTGYTSPYYWYAPFFIRALKTENAFK